MTGPLLYRSRERNGNLFVFICFVKNAGQKTTGNHNLSIKIGIDSQPPHAHTLAVTKRTLV